MKTNLSFDFMLIDVFNSILFITILYYTVNKINPINNKQYYDKDYCLILGYKNEFKKKDIIVDMRLTPHLLVSGLSGQGKSKAVEYMMKDKKCVILNCFSEDFKSLNCKKVNNIKEVENILLRALKTKKLNKPFYIVIDELLVLSNNKRIMNIIKQLLAIARHKNIYLIGISQRGLSIELSFKNLFNTRMTFRQIEETSYRAVLGINIEKQLNKREFVVVSDGIYFGKTYNV